MRFDGTVLRPLMKISLPSAAESGSIQVGMMIFSLITISLGTAAFAAQQIVFTIANLSMMPGVAFSIASTTLVGQALGANNPATPSERLARRAWPRSGCRSWARSSSSSPSSSPECILTTGSHPSDRDRPVVVGFGQPLQGIAFVLAGALRGAGDTKTTLFVGTASMWLVRLPIAYSAAMLGLGVFGIWLAWAADWALRSVLLRRRVPRRRVEEDENLVDGTQMNAVDMIDADGLVETRQSASLCHLRESAFRLVTSRTVGGKVQWRTSPLGR